MVRPKFITFDCYGTLTRFRMAELTREIYRDRIPGERMAAFVESFRGYRLDEVLGAWKPFVNVLKNAVERTCEAHGITFAEADGQRYYDAVPTWGPHDDVPAGLAKVAAAFPLVGLTNAADAQIMTNVAMYGAPFHRVITAEAVRSYKPRMKGFEDMLDILGARPDELLHVSSSFRYDLMTAHDLGIKNKAWVNRGHEPANRNRQEENLPVARDPENTSQAYQLGRLFAVIELAQKRALPKLNATVADRFFGAVSSTPARVFPSLLRKTGMQPMWR